MTITRFKLGGALWVLGALLFTSCHKNVSAPPPPPPPAAPAAPPAAAPTITLRANPTTIERGGSTTLQWTAQNATTIRIEPGVGEVNGNGNRQVSPTSSVTYTATATGPGGTASDTARITVNAAAAAEPPIRNTAAPNVQQLFSSNVQTIYFDYDKSEIRADQMTRLRGNASWLKQNPGIHFTIEGYCDERGSQEYNLALGDRRANAVKDYLVSQGIPDANIRVISYGEDRPVCSEQSEDCYQRNRRAEFVLNP